MIRATQLLVVALVVLMAVMVTTAAAGDVWQELETGLEMAHFDSRTSTVSDEGDLMVLRVEPRIFSLRLLATDRQADKPGRDVAQWCRDEGLIAAINAGMYQADMRTHVGFCQVDGVVLNGFANDYLSAVAFDPVDVADPPFRIFDLDETPLDEVQRRYQTVVQNLRLIKRSGENRWQPATDQWREAALAEDHRGRALLIYCRTAWSMHEFNEILLALPLDVVAAQHLEGRSPARFWIDHPEYKASPEAPAPGPELPNVIGVVRSPDSGEPDLNEQ